MSKPCGSKYKRDKDSIDLFKEIYEGIYYVSDLSNAEKDCFYTRQYCKEQYPNMNQKELNDIIDKTVYIELKMHGVCDNHDWVFSHYEKPKWWQFWKRTKIFFKCSKCGCIKTERI